MQKGKILLDYYKKDGKIQNKGQNKSEVLTEDDKSTELQEKERVLRLLVSKTHASDIEGQDVLMDVMYSVTKLVQK